MKGYIVYIIRGVGMDFVPMKWGTDSLAGVKFLAATLTYG